jgi:hypothetical protein
MARMSEVCGNLGLLLLLTLQRWLQAFLERPRAQVRTVGLALLLLLPCLATSFVLDDHVLAVKAGPVLRMAALPPEPLRLFTFTTGDPTRNALLMDEGALLPWWSEPRHLNAFFRPLSALTHVLDFRLWPGSAALMHLHSVLWFGLLLVVLGHVYRTLENSAERGGAGALVAAFALLLYAIDDAHGATVGWIANRNALISSLLALPALSAHHRAVTEGRPRWLAPLWLMLGLCAGETAFCVAGYLVAYAVCLDERSATKRLWSLVPFGLLLLAHRGLYHVFGLGSFGSGAYHEPLREPLAFAATLGYNLPVLLAAQLFIPLADVGFWGDTRARAVLWGESVLVLLVLTGFCASLLRRDKLARFWALGMLLAAAPVSASLPGERLLIAVGFGAAPLLARLLLDAQILNPEVRLPHGARRGLISALVVLHLVVAPAALPVRACAFGPIASASARFDAGLPREPSIRDKTVVVLNAPFTILLSYLQIARAQQDVPRPAHLYWLSTAGSQTHVTRTAANELLVDQDLGFLSRPEDTHYRADLSGLRAGTRIDRAGMQVEVVSSLPDGRPGSVRFRFAEPLESMQYDFRIHRDGELVPWQPGPVGETISLPAQEFFQIVLAEVLR